MTQPRITEAAFQRRVTDLAKFRQWRFFHDQDSRRNTAGLPDLLLVRRGRFIAAELKTNSGRLSLIQQGWLTDLSACPGVEVYVWRPDDWDEVQKVLA